MYSAIVFTVLFCILPLECELEKGWKGIKVFESTRSQVEKALGKSTEDNSQTTGVVTYKTDSELVHVIFSSERCSEANRVRGKYKLDSNVVLNYEVVPMVRLTIAELDWNKDLYQKREDKHVLRLVYYENAKDGVFVEAVKPDENSELVQAIRFRPTSEQKSKFQCESIEKVTTPDFVQGVRPPLPVGRTGRDKV